MPGIRNGVFGRFLLQPQEDLARFVGWGAFEKNQKSEQTTRNPAACADVATGGVVG